MFAGNNNQQQSCNGFWFEASAVMDYSWTGEDNFFYPVRVQIDLETKCFHSPLQSRIYCVPTYRPTEYQYASHGVIINPFKPEFTIVIFIHHKPRMAVAILDL